MQETDGAEGKPYHLSTRPEVSAAKLKSAAKKRGQDPEGFTLIAASVGTGRTQNLCGLGAKCPDAKTYTEGTRVRRLAPKARYKNDSTHALRCAGCAQRESANA